MAPKDTGGGGATSSRFEIYSACFLSRRRYLQFNYDMHPPNGPR